MTNCNCVRRAASAALVSPPLDSIPNFRKGNRTLEDIAHMAETWSDEGDKRQNSFFDFLRFFCRYGGAQQGFEKEIVKKKNMQD